MAAKPSDLHRRLDRLAARRSSGAQLEVPSHFRDAFDSQGLNVDELIDGGGVIRLPTHREGHLAGLRAMVRSLGHELP